MMTLFTETVKLNRVRVTSDDAGVYVRQLIYTHEFATSRGRSYDTVMQLIEMELECDICLHEFWAEINVPESYSGPVTSVCPKCGSTVAGMESLDDDDIEAASKYGHEDEDEGDALSSV